LHNAKKARELQTEIEILGKKALIVQADVTDELSTLTMSRVVLDAFGKLDVVVANAVSGVPRKSGRLLH